jgi:hypothetical protein
MHRLSRTPWNAHFCGYLLPHLIFEPGRELVLSAGKLCLRRTAKAQKEERQDKTKGMRVRKEIRNKQRVQVTRSHDWYQMIREFWCTYRAYSLANLFFFSSSQIARFSR